MSSAVALYNYPCLSLGSSYNISANTLENYEFEQSSTDRHGESNGAAGILQTVNRYRLVPSTTQYHLLSLYFRNVLPIHYLADASSVTDFIASLMDVHNNPSS